MNSTRRYPRTTAEAFKGIDYSCAVERPAPRYPRSLWWVMAFGFLFALFTVRFL